MVSKNLIKYFVKQKKTVFCGSSSPLSFFLSFFSFNFFLFLFFLVSMLHIYATLGLWKSSTNGWKFVVDGKKGGRLLALESNDTFEELQMMVSEEFGIVDNSVDLELSYLPSELINNKESPPVNIATDGQVRNFVGYARNQPSTHLCVTCKALFKFNLNEEPLADSINREDEGSLGEKGEEFVTPNGKKEHFKGNISDVEVGDGDDVLLLEDNGNSAKTVRFSLVEAIKKKQHFRSKNFLKATMEICAMQHNFDYKVIKSDTMDSHYRKPISLS